jgi:hypothetical protein
VSLIYSWVDAYHLGAIVVPLQVQHLAAGYLFNFEILILMPKFIYF